MTFGVPVGKSAKLREPRQDSGYRGSQEHARALLGPIGFLCRAFERYCTGKLDANEERDAPPDCELCEAAGFVRRARSF